MELNKETKIFIGVMLVLIGGTIILATYVKKKMLKDTFEYYDNNAKGVQILNENKY